MPPAAAAAALIPAAAGALPGIIAGATHAGKSNARVGNFNETPDYDPTKTQFGGRAGGADEMAARERATADNDNTASAQDRDYANQMRGESEGARNLGLQDRGLALQDRDRQAEAQNLMIDRAKGRNLISTQVANQARTGLRSQLASQTASARGAAGLANAQSDAMAAGAQGLGQINQNEQISSMQEQQAAEQAAFGAASGMQQGAFGMAGNDAAMRGQDINAMGQSLNSAAQFGQLGLGYTGQENQTRATQMQGGIAQQQIAAGSKQAGDALNVGVNQANAGRDLEYIKMAAGGASGGAQSGMPAPGVPPQGAGAGGGGTPPPTSDPLAKSGIVGLGMPSGSSGPSGGSSYQLGSQANLDVNGTLKANSDFATQFQRDPTGGMGGGGVLSISDPKAKADVLPLYEPPGKELHQSLEGHAYLADEPNANDGRASLSGPTPRYSKAPDVSAATPAKARPSEMTIAQLRAAANEMERSMRGQHDALLAAGPAARRLASGSPDSNYETELTSGAERAFRSKFGFPEDKEERVLGRNTGSDYDLRGAFASGATDGQRFVKYEDGIAFPGHLPDTFKKPSHETFSDESQYAQYEPGRSGHWENGDRYVPHGAPAWLRNEMERGDDRASPTPPMRSRNPNEGPFRDPDGTDNGDEDWSIWDDDRTQARQGTSGPTLALNMPHASDPAAKRDAYRLGLEQGAAHATKYLTGQEMAPWSKDDAPAEDEESPQDPVAARDDLQARGFVAPSPHELPPPPPPPRQMESFQRDQPVSTQRQDKRATLGVNFAPVTRSRMPAPSDPRAKDLGGVHDNEVAQTLDDVPAVSYRYKDPSYEPEAQHPGERQAGFLTSDLKNSPLGKAVVEQRPDGLEGYNQHRMIGLQYAEIRNLHERLRDLEAALAKGGGRG